MSISTRVVALGLVVLALAALAPRPAVALAAYDPPALSAVQTGLFNVVLQVRAGDSGAPAGFAVQWMKLDDYFARGGWPADVNDPAIVYGRFTGTPTLHLSPETSTYRLAPATGIRTEPGDFFDATGLATNYVDALSPSTMYVFRAYALGDANGLASAYTPTLTVATLVAECTQGFWKNHPETWPASALPMMLGTVSYTKAQLLDIFGQPAQGNGLVSLAHQLIAAKLNLASGSDPTPIAGAIAAADALIGALVVPPVGGGSLAPSATDALTQALDDYNNGRLGGVLPCPTDAQKSTWGKLKSLYR